MRLHWLVPSLTALALGFAHTPSAHAEAQSDLPVSTAVLGLEGTDVPMAVTDEIAEQLRQRISSTRDMRLVSGKDLVEVKLVFSCADEAASCMAQAGKSLDAQKLIYGSVKRSGDDYVVWLKMFDVRRAKIESGLTDTLPRRNADPAGMKSASARWFARLTGRSVNAGVVQVTSNVVGATVTLDGVPMGATGDQPLTISEVAAGNHELLVSKAGQTPFRHQITVGSGQTVPVNATLGALAPSGPAVAAVAVAGTPQVLDVEHGAIPSDKRASGPGDGRGGYRTGFWVTLAAGVVSAAGAVKFGLDVSDVNKKLDPYRRFPCGNQLCDSKGVVRPALTTAEKSSVTTLNNDGNRDQTLQWICVGVGSALGLASGYLLYKGYLDAGDETSRPEAHRGLRIFPTAGASVTGIVAEFEF